MSPILAPAQRRRPRQVKRGAAAADLGYLLPSIFQPLLALITDEVYTQRAFVPHNPRLHDDPPLEPPSRCPHCDRDGTVRVECLIYGQRAMQLMRCAFCHHVVRRAGDR
jgi:hypothetical protein